MAAELLLGASALIVIVAVIVMCASRKKRSQQVVLKGLKDDVAVYPVLWELKPVNVSSKLGSAVRAEWSDMELPPMGFELLGLLRKTDHAVYFKALLNVRTSQKYAMRVCKSYVRGII